MIQKKRKSDIAINAECDTAINWESSASSDSEGSVADVNPVDKSPNPVLLDSKPTDKGDLVEKSNTTSEAWSHFKVYSKNAGVAVCNHCRKEVKYGDKSGRVSTSKLTGHLNRKHPALYRSELLKKSEGKIAMEAAKWSKPISKRPLHQQEITNIFVPKAHGELFPTRYVDWIVSDIQPLNTCESLNFRRMCDALNHKVPPLGRERVHTLLLQQEADVKATIKLMLKSIAPIAITTDGWTSLANQSYTAVTGHYIDKNSWEMKKIVFGCFPKFGRATAQQHLVDIQVN